MIDARTGGLFDEARYRHRDSDQNTVDRAYRHDPERGHDRQGKLKAIIIDLPEFSDRLHVEQRKSANTRTAPNAAFGTYRKKSVRNRNAIMIAAAATSPVTCVRPPAATPMAVR